MKEDIEIPIAKDVHVAIVQEWDKEFLSKEWNAYIVNNRTSAIEMVLVVSKGFDGERKTSLMRHAIGVVEKKSFEKIEMVQQEVLSLNNEFFVTYYADNKLYEKRFIFKKGSVKEANLIQVPLLAKPGVILK